MRKHASAKVLVSATLIAAALAAATGCSTSANTGAGGGATTSTGTTPTTSTSTGSSGAIDFSTATPAMAPPDATPDAAGASIFYIADDASAAPGVYQVASDGAQPTKLFSGAPLVDPLGIAYMPKDKVVYVADPAAGIYGVPEAGGTPTLVAGTDTLKPLALDVDDATQTIYFTSGKDGTLYKIPSGGGTAAAVSEAGKFQDAEGVAVAHKASAETVYVVDRKDGKSGTLYRVTGGKSSEVASGFYPGAPSGVALDIDENLLLVSAFDATGKSSEVDIFSATTGTKKVYNDAIKQNHASGGLHRAYNANIFAWADLSSGAGGSGTVYRVNLH